MTHTWLTTALFVSFPWLRSSCTHVALSWIRWQYVRNCVPVHSFLNESSNARWRFAVTKNSNKHSWAECSSSKLVHGYLITTFLWPSIFYLTSPCFFVITYAPGAPHHIRNFALLKHSKKTHTTRRELWCMNLHASNDRKVKKKILCSSCQWAHGHTCPVVV